MSAKVLTADDAKKANIVIIENGKGTQAVYDVVTALRANPAPVRPTPKPKPK